MRLCTVEIVYRPLEPLERDRSFCRSSAETRSWYSACFGNVGAQWHDAEMVGACEIEPGTGKFGGEALALKDRGNFNMVKDDTVRKAAIGEECTQAVDLRFKALSFFVVCDGDAVEV